MKEYKDDDLQDRAAALTYFGIQSIFPGLLVLVSLLGFVGKSATQPLISSLSKAAPPSVGTIIDTGAGVFREAAAYKKHAPEPSARYLHRCHTKVPPLHPKPGDFQAIRSTTRSTAAVDSALRSRPIRVWTAIRICPVTVTTSLRWSSQKVTGFADRAPRDVPRTPTLFAFP